MTSIERTAYPRFKRYFTNFELESVYTPTKAEIAFGYSCTTGQSNFFNLIVFLKVFQRLGYFPKQSKIPASIVEHICSSLKLPSEIVLGYNNRKTMSRHRHYIRDYLKVIAFDKQALHLTAVSVYRSAQIMDNPADLINVAIEELIRVRYELPGFNTLDRLVRHIRYLVNQKLFALVINSLDRSRVQRLDDLLDTHPIEHRSPYNNLKQLPKRPTRNHLNDLFSHLTWLSTFGEVKPCGEWLPNQVDLSFANARWQKLIINDRGKQTLINRRHFEICVFSYLAAELKSGDICVIGSEEYADYREQLLSWSECQPLVAQYCNNLGLAADAEAFVAQLKSTLTETANRVDSGYPDNGQAIVNEKGEIVLKRSPRIELSPSAQILVEAVEERFTERNLVDILRNVDYWTNFTRHFGPISGSDPKLENATLRYLLTTFTYGCNLGATQAARHMKGAVTARELSFVNRRHVSADKLNAALRNMIDRYNVLGIPKLWGDGTTAAADGTKYELYEENLLSEYHIRYGGYGGIAYHHVADSYVALFSHFIPCGTWEAVYILEGLLKNKSDIQPHTIHADTQGQSTPVFALAHLLGIKLMPRIRNWQDLIFYRPDSDSVYQHIDLLFKEAIDWERIANHWQDLMRVVLSISSGKISSSVLLRKLGNYSRKNRLYQAFQELGRAVRTIFLLQYISDIQLRQQITAATNKVESYHGFSKWFFFGGFGVIAHNDPEEQEKIIKYNDLIANAVVFHNVVDLTEVLRQLQREGYIITSEDVAALSPYMTSHIKRFGDYLLDLKQVPQGLDELTAFVL